MYRACEYVFLTPSALGRRRYRQVCAEFDLEPRPRGYGALLCHAPDGREVTTLTTDPDYLAMTIQTLWHFHTMRPSGEPDATSVDPSKFRLVREGWPAQHCRGGV